MQMMSHSHPAEDVLEQYAMDKLSEAEAVPVEEHLLVCQGCRERLALLDDFVRSIRSAARATSRAAASGHRD
jgi:anti-sigma factor ChrR (cupin superfamily)